MKNPIVLSINPTYLCNFSCEFCYLTPEQLKDPAKIDLSILDQKLSEISKHRLIDHIDLYGGEIGVLPREYTEKLIDLISCYYDGTIYLTSNLSKLTDLVEHERIYTTISWDFVARERYDKVFENIKKLTKPFSIQMLVSKAMENWTENELNTINSMLNSLDLLHSFELKPYSRNQANCELNLEPVYERLVRFFVENSKNYLFINEQNIQQSLNKSRNPFSDDLLYIRPNGEFAVLDFDNKGREYFREVKNYEDYLSWQLNEKMKVFNQKYCNECSYLGHCLSEHLRPDEGVNGYCSGFRGLLDWYATRSQDKTAVLSAL